MGAAGLTGFAKSLEGGNAAARLVELTGGIEKLASGTQYFVDNFLTDAEKIKPSMDLVSDTMKRLGYASVDTVEEFKNLVQGLDKSTEAEAQLFAELIAIAPQFKNVADYVTASTKALEENAAAATLAKKIDDERKALQDELNQLTMTSAQLLDLQRSALDSSNVSIFNNIQAVKAKEAADAAAVAQAAAVASQRATLQDELDRMTLTEAQLLEKKRATYYTQNLDLVDQINAENEKLAIEKQNAAMFEALAREQAETQAAQVKQREDAARAAQEVARQMQDAANKTREAWQGLTDSVYNEVRRIRGLTAGTGTEGLAAAQANFAITSARAAAGDQAAYAMLPELSKAITSIAEQQAPTLSALRLIQAQTAASLVATSNKLGFPIPSFAVGSTYVPRDMIAQIHAGESINTRQQTARGAEANAQASNGLIERVEMLSFELKAIAGHTAMTARLLDRVIQEDKVQVGTDQAEPLPVKVM